MKFLFYQQFITRLINVHSNKWCVFSSFLSFFAPIFEIFSQVFLALTRMFKYDMSSIRMPLLGSASTIKFQLDSLIRRIASWKIGKFPAIRFYLHQALGRLFTFTMPPIVKESRIFDSNFVEFSSNFTYCTVHTRFSICQSWILRLIWSWIILFCKKKCILILKPISIVDCFFDEF